MRILLMLMFFSFPPMFSQASPIVMTTCTDTTNEYVLEFALVDFQDDGTTCNVFTGEIRLFKKGGIAGTREFIGHTIQKVKVLGHACSMHPVVAEGDLHDSEANKVGTAKISYRTISEPESAEIFLDGVMRAMHPMTCTNN